MIHILKYSLIKVCTLAILILIINSLSILAQRVASVTENGNYIELPRSLLQDIASNPDANKQIILEWYASNGYMNVSLTKITDYQFEVIPGCRFLFSKLNIHGDNFENYSITDLGNYSSNLLQLKVKDLLAELESDGYLYSSIEIESINPISEACKVSVTLKIDEGRKWISEKILFPGAVSNNPSYLQRITRYTDSLLITSRLLNELKSNLNASELFEEVADPAVFIENEKAIIVIGLRERVLNQFDGLIGYVPNANGEGQIVGDMKLSLWNVLNQGNGFNLEYQRLKPETTRLITNISQDWIGAIPVGLGFNFNLYQNDTTYQTRNLSLDSYYLVTQGLRLTSEIGQINSTSSNSAPLILEPDGKKRYAEFGFRYSTLNNYDVPTSGIEFNIDFGVAKKSLEIDSISTFSQRYIHSDASYYLPLSNKSVLAFSSQAYFLNSNRVTENDLIWFGGANSFRGYSEEQFRASRLIWGDIEYRFLTNRSSYLFAFGAIGGYHRPKLVTETDYSFVVTDYLYSTGFGISYKIKIGRLKFAYAISPDENIGNGKIHFGIITRL